MNNEPLRVLSDYGESESAVNQLTAGDATLSDDAVFSKNGSWALDALGALARTLEHQQHCVVGTLERCDATALAVSFFFPWFDTFSCAVHDNANQHTPRDSEALADDVVAEIKRQNALELFSYDAADRMLDAQLAVICDYAHQHNETNAKAALLRRRRRRLGGGVVVGGGDDDDTDLGASAPAVHGQQRGPPPLYAPPEHGQQRHHKPPPLPRPEAWVPPAVNFSRACTFLEDAAAAQTESHRRKRNKDKKRPSSTRRRRRA